MMNQFLMLNMELFCRRLKIIYFLMKRKIFLPIRQNPAITSLVLREHLLLWWVLRKGFRRSGIRKLVKAELVYLDLWTRAQTMVVELFHLRQMHGRGFKQDGPCHLQLHPHQKFCYQHDPPKILLLNYRSTMMNIF